MGMSEEEGQDACDGEQERFVKIESLAGQVLVRDDEGNLDEMEEMAKGLHQEAEQATARLQDDDKKREVQ